MFCAREIERQRLAEIVYIRRLTGATAPPPNSPSEWTGWQVVIPDQDARVRLQRIAAGLCARCGNAPPRAGRRTCQRCADGQAKRAAALRARRKAGGACAECGAPAGDGQTRYGRCRDRYRGAGRWARPAAS